MYAMIYGHFNPSIKKIPRPIRHLHRGHPGPVELPIQAPLGRLGRVLRHSQVLERSWDGGYSDDFSLKWVEMGINIEMDE